MSPETPYRIAFAIVIALVMPIAAYHRIRAASSRERISHQAEGYRFAIVLRVVGLFAWLSVFAYLLFPNSVAWASLPLPAWLRWSGVALAAACSFLMFWTLNSLGNNLTDTVVTRQNATLVTCGPYRFVRHPFYITVGLFLAGLTLISGSSLIGIGSALVLALLAIRTPKEEQMLVARFGPAYQDYMARTGRFFPRLFKKPAASPAPID